jgi:hypothetical protein
MLVSVVVVNHWLTARVVAVHQHVLRTNLLALAVDATYESARFEYARLSALMHVIMLVTEPMAAWFLLQYCSTA